MDEGLIYEILSVVEEIPEGCVATYGQIARLIGREGSQYGGILWEVSVPQGSQPCRAAGSRMEGAGVSAASGKGSAEG